MENFSDDKGKDKEDLTNWIERGKMRIVEKIIVLKTLDEAVNNKEHEWQHQQ